MTRFYKKKNLNGEKIKFFIQFSLGTHMFFKNCLRIFNNKQEKTFTLHMDIHTYLHTNALQVYHNIILNKKKTQIGKNLQLQWHSGMCLLHTQTAHVIPIT